VTTETLPPFLQRVKALGHRVFTSGTLNVNFIAVRCNYSKAGTFDDWISCHYRNSDGAWQSHWWPGTTDPGLYWLEGASGGNPRGTAIMKPGQYPGLWKIGLHHKSDPAKAYKAFEQTGVVTVYRDRNKDAVLDLDPRTEESGVLGINLHSSDSNPWDPNDKDRTQEDVGAYSAGCIVFARSSDFRHAVTLGEQSTVLGHGSTFTCTLVRASDVFQK
jgi:hypothetical protein